MGLALEANGGGSLLDSLHGVLDLVKTAVRGPGGHIAVVLVTEL